MDYKVISENGKEYLINFDNSNSGNVNGKAFNLDVVNEGVNHFHTLFNNKSYNVELVDADHDKKIFTIKVNDSIHTLTVKDKFDELLKSLGLENLNAVKVNEIKSPMPGLVLEIKVEVGTEVKKGDGVIVLEAMKMENILKSPADGKVKKILVSKGNAVEKNEILIQFE